MTWTLAFDILLTHFFTDEHAHAKANDVKTTKRDVESAERNERTAKYEQYGFVILLQRRQERRQSP